MTNALLERFIRYAKINTRSDENSQTIPTTQSQVDFARNVLEPELLALGLKDVHYLESNGYLVATLPANDARFTRKIGFISHMDTADFNADGVNPQVIENYQGGEIPLGTSGFVLSPQDFPQLEGYLGQTLITTDGTTLLGSDDKSGIAEIITALAYLVEHPEIKHGEIRVGFGPDEEIGRGAIHFDVADFDVDFAYTVDGGPLGELQYETFSAAAADLAVQGRNVHPGTAKNQMVHALQVLMDIHAELPENERAETTEGREGFYHLLTLAGTVDAAESHYILRDFDREGLESKKARLQQLVDQANRQFGQERVTLTVTDQYANMREVIEKDMTPINLAKQAMNSLGIEPVIEPIRGGTDGSTISFMGIPTPNLFAGGENMHGRYEFVSLQTMEKAVEVIVAIVSQSDNV